MSRAKTKVDIEVVESFVRENFSSDAHSFESTPNGETSQAFFFSSRGSEYVIRVNKKINGFEKDKYAHQWFHSSEIPIPETLSLGKLNDNLYFSITRRAEGKLLSELSKEKILQTIPSILETLDAIHAVDISNTSGLGCFDVEGKTDVKTHRNYLEKLITEMPKNFENESSNKLLEKNVIKQLLEKYKTFLNYCPNIRYLVHSDFGFNNVTVKGSKITGVFDWERARYGDFLYDVAWLDFWGNRGIPVKKVNYKQIFLEHYREKGVDIKNYDERILLYKLNFGIGAMIFFANSQQEEKYLETKAHLLELIKDL